MYRSYLSSAVLCVLAARLASGSDNEFLREKVVSILQEKLTQDPKNFTPSIYEFTGSYYNGTTTLEYNYEALPECENYSKNGTITSTFQSIFSVGPSVDNTTSSKSPVNMLWVMWDEDFDIADHWQGFSAVNATMWGTPQSEHAALKWLLPSFSVNQDDWIIADKLPDENFPLSIIDTDGDHYKVEGNLTSEQWVGISPIATGPSKIGFFKAPACNGSETISAYVDVSMFLQVQDVTHVAPRVEFEFDSESANATFSYNKLQAIGYSMQYGYPLSLDTDGNTTIPGTLKLGMSASIDPWHSDILIGDNDTPSWKATVGYNESYYAYPVDNKSSATLHSSSGMMAALWVAVMSTVFMLS
ncbi:hypothetical protein N7478_004352 [Penicillium angulare]|uniref:uncharacterized protein n=1 Tax=Penicillium angulare TaxID=116970 RepID=UPI0025406818|nr:uncharacterized protein N7478_004352 [Penicillium angulare]KAJ5278980.1 hypothetical protein N7478_004352 [Penicillium angulare]